MDTSCCIFGASAEANKGTKYDVWIVQEYLMLILAFPQQKTFRLVRWYLHWFSIDFFKRFWTIIGFFVVDIVLVVSLFCLI